MHNTKTLFILAIIIAIFAGIFIIVSKDVLDRSPSQTDTDNGIACTLDAMECPDGSYVGRIPPSCEFAPCPGN